jgi:hypothetical protein
MGMKFGLSRQGRSMAALWVETLSVFEPESKDAKKDENFIVKTSKVFTLHQSASE